MNDLCNHNDPIAAEHPSALDDWQRFTGLLDKHGKKIFEGDIMRILERDWSSKTEEDKRTIDQYMQDISSIAEVVFEDGSYMAIPRIKGRNYHSHYVGNTPRRDICEIIGNIYTDSHLLNK